MSAKEEPVPEGFEGFVLLKPTVDGQPALYELRECEIGCTSGVMVGILLDKCRRVFDSTNNIAAGVAKCQIKDQGSNKNKGPEEAAKQ